MGEFIFATICLSPFIILISMFIYIGIHGMFYHDIEISEDNKETFFNKVMKYQEAGYYPISDYTIDYYQYKMRMRKKLRDPKDFIKGKIDDKIQK